MVVDLDFGETDSAGGGGDGRDRNVDRGGGESSGEVEGETGGAVVGERAADDVGTVSEGDQGREDLVVRVDAVCEGGTSA